MLHPSEHIAADGFADKSKEQKRTTAEGPKEAPGSSAQGSNLDDVLLLERLRTHADEARPNAHTGDKARKTHEALQKSHIAEAGRTDKERKRLC